MDSSVIAAIAKWPNVPAVFGWLALTARGEWRLRSEPIRNAAICAFMARNYASDERGRWFFQNGPQRIYVALEVAPWIWRIGLDAARAEVCAHTGASVTRLGGAWVDDLGRLFLRTDLGFGLVDSADTTRAFEALRRLDGHLPDDAELESWIAGRGPPLRMRGEVLGLQGEVELERLQAEAAPEIFRYVLQPA
jgi:Protein of unknown function (DUF2946)